jgi:hypothetical protein
MMSVVISGPRNGKVKNDIQDKVLDVSYFCMRQLNILRFNGWVHVKIWNDLKGASGYCAAERVTINNRNEWEVVIDVVYDKECMAEFISTLCHEFIHAKQYLRKELSECGTKWKGVPLKDDKKDPWGFKLPHEKEAYKKERIIFKRIKKGNDLKWVNNYDMIFDRGY